jgi:FKBP-type peptidyl-prolyl cis-trans isomerase
VVTIEYTGWYLGPAGNDPTIWETTWDGWQPMRFEVGAGRMIRGIDRGVRGLRAGAVRQLRIPAELAFADWGLPGRLPPWAEVVVDLEVLAVEVAPDVPADVAYAPIGDLLIADLTVGEGAEVGAGSTIVADWVVWDAQGEALDDTWTSVGPYRLPVDQLRIGAGLVGMRAGGVRQIRVPPSVRFDAGDVDDQRDGEPVDVQLFLRGVAAPGDPVALDTRPRAP